MNDDKIEYVNCTPVEANWFRLELPFPDLEPWFNATGFRRTEYLTFTKQFMANEGLIINVDFKIASDYYSKNIVLLIHPDKEKYASMIKLKWK